MITLREINRDNFHNVIGLSVFEGQEVFVASNIYSLAQAKAQPECMPLAIYNDDTLVGFVMYCMDYEDKEYWIYRLLIDRNHQKKGYGKFAMQQVIDRVKEDKAYSKLYVSFQIEPENTVAKTLYESLGFVPPRHLSRFF